MTAKILDGKALSRDLETALRIRVESIVAHCGKTPILATILVGEDPASATYVQMKGNACKRGLAHGILLVGSFAESPSQSARRTRRLDPGGRNDFGGRL